MKSRALIILSVLLSACLIHAAPPEGKGPGKAPAEMGEAVHEDVARHAKKANQESKRVSADDEAEKGDMPKGLAKQAEKKAEQPQKDMEKASDTAKEKRRKWWKFWSKED